MDIFDASKLLMESGICQFLMHSNNRPDFESRHLARFLVLLRPFGCIHYYMLPKRGDR